MSIVRNTVVLRNAALGALVVLSLFECNGFVAVRFGIKGVFCKENVVTHCARAVYTARVPVHGTYTARSLPCTQPCTHAYMYTAVTRPCTRHIHGRVHSQYTAVYTGHVHGPYTAL